TPKGKAPALAAAPRPAVPEGPGPGYGLYCGPLRVGPGAPIDTLDSACSAHDACLATVADFLKPFRRRYCDFLLCKAALSALATDCDADWPPIPAIAGANPQNVKCKVWAAILSQIFCNPIIGTAPFLPFPY